MPVNGERSRSASKVWGETVRSEHAQADRVRSDDPSADHWRSLAHRFKPMSRESAVQDESYIAVSRYVRESDVVIDVGAGAGRLAIPIAEHCNRVVAVEPSEAMQEQLRNQADAWGIDNIQVIESTWEEAEVEPADVIICAHVVYTVEDIAGFIRKLSRNARREVLIIVFEEPAMANYFELWRLIYGEDRISLPSLSQLEEVLAELGITYEKHPLDEWESRPFSDAEKAYEESLARLFITTSNENTELQAKLRAVLQDSLVPVEGGMRFRWARPHRPWLVRWTT